MAAATLLKSAKGHVLGQEEPLTLENLVKQCTQTKGTWGRMQNDIVFAFTFWSMVECGFQCISREKTLPKDWKHETRQVYQAQFVLPPYSDYPVKLVALPADDILCINVLASNISPKNIHLKSLAIHSPGYVPRPEEDTILSKFSDLNDFQFLLKNVIIWPIRCSILTDQGITNGSFCGVSDEIKLKIVRHLCVTDVLMLSQTCHDLNRICNDQGLWKSLFHENFKYLCKCATETNECDELTDWKVNFKQAYIQKRNEKSFQDSPAESFVTAPEGPNGSEVDFDID